MVEWFEEHQTVVLWMAGLSFVTFVTTLISIPVFVVRMPADYFFYRAPPPDSWRAQHRVVRYALLILKNVLGVLLVLAGMILALPLVPGQGILTVLVGLSLLDFPGKRALELRLARERHVLGAINWMRAKSNRPPLVLPPS